MRLNLGSGSRPLDGFVNVDVVRLPGVDQLHDLNVFPWPWKAGEVQEIHAHDVYEHVFDPLAFMAECHRILEPGGQLYIHTAYWKNPDSYADPTHRRFLTEKSFDYWIRGTERFVKYGPAYNRGCEFELRDLHLDGPLGDLNVTLVKP